jgi:hypothetical protein
MDRDEMSKLYRGPPIDASYQVSVHLAKRFQRRRFFRNQPIRNKNCLWWPCLLGSIYGRSSIKIAHFVLIHWQTWPPQAILVSDWPILKNILLWNRLAKWTETWLSFSHRGPSIDTSYHVSVHLAKRFQRRRLLEIDQSETRIACGSHVC